MYNKIASCDVFVQLDSRSGPLGTGETEQKKKTYWPGEESDDQSAAEKTKSNKSVAAGKAKVTCHPVVVHDYCSSCCIVLTI